MMYKIAKHVTFAFSRSQNFFEMNPVFPDMGEKDFDLYNTQRKTIPALDAYMQPRKRIRQKRELVRRQILAKKYDKFKKFSGSKKFRLDQETNLLIGLDSDFDEFIKNYKANKLVTKNAKSQFKNSLINLVHKFNCKSQPELIRLFRITIANSKQKNVLDKMRGKIMEQALMKSSAIRRMQLNKDSDNFTKQIEEDQYEKILKQLDQKIDAAQQILSLNQYGLPNKMSDYDPKYGWKIEEEITPNDRYDLNTKLGGKSIIKTQQYDSDSTLQDQAIKARINRLYFLRRLELLKKQTNQHVSVLQDLPINLNQRQNIMNQIAHKYKEEQLLQEPDLSDIYREVDIVIDKIFVKISSYTSKNSDKLKSQEVYDHAPDNSRYLWQNIKAEQILCSDIYSYDSLKRSELSQQTAKQLSPHPDLQISLSSMPLNLYRHSQFQIFGVYNQKIMKNSRRFIDILQRDYQPDFNQFTIQKAQKQYEKFEQRVKEGQQTSIGKAKRKTSQSQVFIVKGSGLVTINGMPIQDYFADVYPRIQSLKPLLYTDTSGLYDVKINVAGGGIMGQAQCIAYAISRALMKINPAHKDILDCFGFVGYDSRIKQAKKTNLYSARVKPPYVRR